MSGPTRGAERGAADRGDEAGLGPRLRAAAAVLFLLGVVAQLEAEVLIGWLGPLVVLVPLGLILRRWLRAPLAFTGAVYAASILGGVLAMEGFGLSNRASARLAGFVLPVALSALGLVVVAVGRRLGPRWLGERGAVAVGRGWSLVGRSAGGAVAGAALGVFAGLAAYYLGDGLDLFADLVFAEPELACAQAGAAAGLVLGALSGVLGPPRGADHGSRR